MRRKIITRLVDFAEICVQEKWPTAQAHRVFELAIELAKARDNKMLLRTLHRLGVENSNDG